MIDRYEIPEEMHYAIKENEHGALCFYEDIEKFEKRIEELENMIQKMQSELKAEWNSPLSDRSLHSGGLLE